MIAVINSNTTFTDEKDKGGRHAVGLLTHGRRISSRDIDRSDRHARQFRKFEGSWSHIERPDAARPASYDMRSFLEGLRLRGIDISMHDLAGLSRPADAPNLRG